MLVVVQSEVVAMGIVSRPWNAMIGAS